MLCCRLAHSFLRYAGSTPNNEVTSSNITRKGISMTWDDVNCSGKLYTSHRWVEMAGVIIQTNPPTISFL